MTAWGGRGVQKRVSSQPSRRAVLEWGATIASLGLIPASARAMSFAIARNVVVERVRREQIVSIEAMADLDVLGIAVDEPGPDRAAMARQDLHRLQLALGQLPEDWRAAVLMRKIDGLSPREIAMRMGVGERTAFRYLSSGLAMLADLFHDDSGGKVP